MTNPIVVVEYDPQWPVAFATIRATLQTALVGVPVIGIEHVGSTSVPGSAAKPIPDLRDEYSSVKRRLAATTDDIDVYVDGIEAGNRL